MTSSEMFNFIKLNNIDCSVFNSKQKYNVIQKMICLAEGDKLHYLWSNFNSPNFISKVKLSCEQSMYNKKLCDILPLGRCILTVDNVCFSDINEDVVIETETQNIISILNEFYWDLDEVYISDKSYNWFISINHNFELFLYGNKIDDVFRYRFNGKYIDDI